MRRCVFTSDGHVYLLDWKKVAQDAPPCNNAEIGMSLKLVSSDTTPNSCADFWGSVGTSKVSILSPARVNPAGWVTSVEYAFRLHHAPGLISIEVRNESGLVAAIQSSDATYPRGRFGFHNYSQKLAGGTQALARRAPTVMPRSTVS